VSTETDSTSQRSPVARHLRAIKIVGLVAAVAVGTLLVSGALSNQRHQPAFPADGPAEFLYLDGARVLAYLAQFDGGNFTSEQLTRRTAETQNGKVSVEDALELGETAQQEESVSRTITPTAAGNYIELLSKLEGLGSLKTIGLRRFQQEVSGLTEGQFVTFRTHALTPPVYVNPYLAVRQRKTLSTLFPMPGAGGPERAAVIEAREGARRFREALGKDPRVVFALRPAMAEIPAERAPGSNLRGERLSPNLRRAEKKTRRRLASKDYVEYLMPMDAQLITRERSLIKFGGGEFTVVGKVVRVFPERGNFHKPAYVDSPTLETWQQPLADAPPMLLCRTDPKCAKKIRRKAGTDAEREKAIHSARKWAIEALVEQTEIPRRGAVIVPVAIYK
jgi:hypothetical protein